MTHLQGANGCLNFAPEDTNSAATVIGQQPALSGPQASWSSGGYFWVLDASLFGTHESSPISTPHVFSSAGSPGATQRAPTRGQEAWLRSKVCHLLAVQPLASCFQFCKPQRSHL